jgi:hypothetical protein
LLGLSETEAAALKEKRLLESKIGETDVEVEGEIIEAVEIVDDEDDEGEEDDEAAFGSFDALEEMKETVGGASAAQRLLAVLTNELPLCHSREKTDDLVRRFIDLQVQSKHVVPLETYPPSFLLKKIHTHKNSIILLCACLRALQTRGLESVWCKS